MLATPRLPQTHQAVKRTNASQSSLSRTHYIDPYDPPLPVEPKGASEVGGAPAWYDAAAVPLFPPFLPFFPPSGAPKSCRWWCGNVVEVMGNGYGNGVSNGTARSGTANKVDATIVYGIVGIDGI